MRVNLRVTSGRGEQESQLAAFLGSQDQLRGRVRLIAERRKPSGMSQSVATVVAELGPAGMVALASALITWIRQKTADTRVTMRRPDGAEFEISAARIRGLDSTQLSALVNQIAGIVSEHEPK